MAVSAPFSVQEVVAAEAEAAVSPASSLPQV
jgi:hypothetical protein